jgi:hypothetical protein
VAQVPLMQHRPDAQQVAAPAEPQQAAVLLQQAGPVAVWQMLAAAQHVPPMQLEPAAQQVPLQQT